MYSQRVGAEDVYLGMSGKTPSTVDCDRMVVKVHLPGVKRAADIDLDVKQQHIRVETREL
jgi:dynein assembly factor 6, axonemal